MVRDLLRRYEIRPSRRRGQNFLIDAQALARIEAAANLSPADGVLEIGPGLGTLTRALARRARQVLAVEIDRRLADALEAEGLAGLENVRVLRADILDLDLRAVLPEHLGPGPHKVVANIPYSITGPLIARLLELHPLVNSAVLMVQKEVAARLLAAPGTADYGALTLLAALHAGVERIGPVSRRCFFPAPEVDSTLIRLTLLSEPRSGGMDPARVTAVVRAAFQQRRKSLRNSLGGSAALGWGPAGAEQALQAAGIDPSRRGETLALEEFVELAAAGEAIR